MSLSEADELAQALTAAVGVIYISDEDFERARMGRQQFIFETLKARGIPVKWSLGQDVCAARGRLDMQADGKGIEFRWIE